MVSPFVSVKVPRVPSVASHFMLFPGVITPNSLLFFRMVVYAASLSSPLSVAEPKYVFPLATARVLRPGLALAAVEVVDEATAVVVAVPAIHWE
jgi:hypothetical protein